MRKNVFQYIAVITGALVLSLPALSTAQAIAQGEDVRMSGLRVVLFELQKQLADILEKAHKNIAGKLHKGRTEKNYEL